MKIFCKHRGASAGCIKTGFVHLQHIYAVRYVLGSIRHCSDGYIRGNGMGGAQSYSLRVDVTQIEGCHGIKHSADLGVDWRIILKVISEK